MSNIVQNTAQTSITETAMTMKSKIFQDESSTQATHPHASVAEKLDTNPFSQLVRNVILRWHQFHENRAYSTIQRLAVAQQHWKSMGLEATHSMPPIAGKHKLRTCLRTFNSTCVQ